MTRLAGLAGLLGLVLACQVLGQIAPGTGPSTTLTAPGTGSSSSASSSASGTATLLPLTAAPVPPPQPGGPGSGPGSSPGTGPVPGGPGSVPGAGPGPSPSPIPGTPANPGSPGQPSTGLPPSSLPPTSPQPIPGTSTQPLPIPQPLPQPQPTQTPAPVQTPEPMAPAAPEPSSLSIPSPAPSPSGPDHSGSLLGRAIPPVPNIPPKITRDAQTYEPQQLVALSLDMNQAIALERELQPLGIRIRARRNLAELGLVMTVLRLPPDASVPDTLAQIRNRYPDLWIDTNQRYPLLQSRRQTYAPQAIGWQVLPGCDAAGTGLGLLDTPVDLNHPSLRGGDIQQQSFVGRDATNTDHATAIASIWLAASSDLAPGLIPRARVRAAAVFRERNKQQETTSEWLLDGLNWLLAEQVQVINLSLGGERNLILELALQRTLARGLTLVAAGGNSGTEAPAVYPAAQPGVIAVAAVDAANKPYRQGNRGDYLDFAAPGVDVWTASSSGKGAYRTGSSYATAYVSALFAIYRAAGLDHDDSNRQLQQTARDLGDPGRDPVFGQGLIAWPNQCPR